MSCAICGCDASNGAPACAGCGREFNARLLWLGRVGMPALQAVAYRQVQLDRGVDRVVRTTAASRPPGRRDRARDVPGRGAVAAAARRPDRAQTGRMRSGRPAGERA